MIFRPLSPRGKKVDQGFAIVEALVAAGISALVLTGSIAIINRQIELASNGRAMAEVRSAINQDIKSIRQYASIWKMDSVAGAVPNLTQMEFPVAMTYASHLSCRAWSRRGSLETSARSDSTMYNQYFPYATQVSIAQNNAIISTIPVTGSTVYEVRRRYTTPTTTSSTQVGAAGTLRDDEIPFTLRITYTVRSVQNNSDGSVSRTDLPVEQTADVNFVAQYSC